MSVSLADPFLEFIEEHRANTVGGNSASFVRRTRRSEAKILRYHVVWDMLTEREKDILVMQIDVARGVANFRWSPPDDPGGPYQVHFDPGSISFERVSGNRIRIRAILERDAVFL